MTYESQPNNYTFPNQYPLPEDQLSFEMDLRNDYAQRYPEALPVFNEALADVQRFGGIGSPKFKIIPEQADDARHAGMADEAGYLSQGDYSSGFSTLMLRMPVERTHDEILSLSEEERLEAQFSDSGMGIVGSLPPETREMIEALYQLTGATVVRDSHEDGDDPGSVIREGSYHNTKIYFSENYNDGPSYYGDKPTFGLSLLGVLSAEVAIHMPSKAEIKEFVAISGINRFDTLKTFAQHNVTRQNYKQIAHVLGATKRIIEGTESREEP